MNLLENQNMNMLLSSIDRFNSIIDFIADNYLCKILETRVISNEIDNKDYDSIRISI